MIESVRGRQPLSLQERAELERRLVENRTGRARAERIPRRQGDGPLPVSFAQQRLWFLEQWAPGSGAYHIPLPLRGKGELDLDALQRALEGIVARHEVLRTNLVASTDGAPVQVIASAGPVPLAQWDLRDLPDQEHEPEMQRRFRDEIARPFNLANDRMVRAAVARLGADEWGMLIVLHHIAADGWSVAPFVRELGALYEGFHTGKPVALPELPIQYADFAVWQRNWLQDEVLDRQLGYWRKQLEGAATLEMPLDHPRPAEQTLRGAAETLAIAPELFESLKQLGQQEGATLFMTLLAAFQTLLQRYTGQDDISVGSPVAGRNRVEIEPLIGFFVNTLVLRTDLSGRPTFRELVRRVREVALGAFSHQDIPFEKLVQELAPERDTSRPPLCQVLFILQNTPRGTLRLPGLTLQRLPVDYRSAKFDLQLTVGETADGLRASLVYNPDLFEAATARRLLAHYQALLQAIAQNPDQPAAELAFRTDVECHRRLVEWNATARPYPRDATVHALFEAQAERMADAVAVVFEDATLTYRELDERANQLAHSLRDRGVGPDVPVAVCVERSLELVIALLGILKAGGAYVPLDPAFPASRLAFMLRDTEANVLVTQQKFAGLLPEPPRHVIVLDGGAESIGQAPTSHPIDRATAENLAYITYTSGSTGTPKGVSVLHRGVVRLVQGSDFVEMTSREVFLQFAPISFDASTLEIWGCLLNGARLVVMPPALPSLGELGAVLKRQGVTTLWLTAGLFHQVVETEPEILAPVRQLLAGGDIVSPVHVRKALQGRPGGVLVNGYGPTEGTTFTCCLRLTSAEQVGGSVSIGRPIANTTVYLLGKDLTPVPVGTPGELFIGGDGLARGYFKRPDLTAERFIPDPFSDRPGARLYRTGDLARYLPDGNLDFLGRIDRQVKVRGFRIELGEIEAALLQHPAVRAATVDVRANGRMDKRLVAYVVLAEPGALSPGTLVHYLEERLPPFMVPSAVVLLDALPLTVQGKVDRRALPAPPDEGTAAADGSASRSPIEVQLTLLWEQALGGKNIGLKDNFFEIGGHSLLAVRVLAEIERTIGQKLPLVSLFQSPTIEQLARILEEKSASARHWPTLVPVKPSGSLPPLFLVARPRANPLGYVFLARHMPPDQPVYVLQSQRRDDEARGPYTQAEYEAAAREYLAAVPDQWRQGPYLLVGMCEGAHIAYEMTRQLEAQRIPVLLLGILDTSARNHEHVRATTALLGLFHPRTAENSRNYCLWYLHNLYRQLARFRRVSLRAKMQKLLGRMARALGPVRRLLRPTADAPPAPRPASRRRQADRDGPLPPVQAPITVFRVKQDHYWRIADRDLGWTDRSKTRVEVLDISGAHTTLLREPFAKDLAATLTRCMAEAVGQGG